jgi:probable F420-dependent oxidoreductase
VTPRGDPLSVRVGVGWNPLDRANAGRPLFWQTVELLEELGYDSLWLSDTAAQGGAAPLPLLAAAAARTERLKLGTSVLVVPARNPLLLAKELATVDVISRGRLFPAFGIGQALPAELAALGVPREERGARLEECVRIVRGLWPGRPVTYRGRFCTLDNVTLTPRPTRSRLEIWLGGSTPAAVRRVARLADGWLASSISPARFGELVYLIRAEAAAAGRSVPEDHFGTVLFVAATEAEAEPLRALRLRAGRPRPTVAIGAEGTRSLLHEFRDAGATKFVIYPLAADPRPLLEELKGSVVDPFEAEPVYRA